jgi:hypothetical protein
MPKIPDKLMPLKSAALGKRFLAIGQCKACEGKGLASKGGKCVPCGGTGRQR